MAHQIPKLECFSSRLAVVRFQSIEARCQAENEDVVEAAPSGSKYIWVTNNLIAYRSVLYKRFYGKVLAQQFFIFEARHWKNEWIPSLDISLLSIKYVSYCNVKQKGVCQTNHGLCRDSKTSQCRYKEKAPSKCCFPYDVLLKGALQ